MSSRLTKSLILPLALIALFALVLTPALVFAGHNDQGGAGSLGGKSDQGSVDIGNDLKLNNPLGDRTVTDVIKGITSFLQTIAVTILTIMILLGAWQMLTSSGNPENFKKGQKTILYAIIGFIIILIANGIADIVKSILEI